MTCHLRGAAALLDKQKGLPALVATLSSATGCTVSVEGVSCLGRCDRAPVAWVERHPMPEGVHAWVYGGRTLAQLEETLRLLVSGEMPPSADDDANYTPNTNTDSTWEIDVYAGRTGRVTMRRPRVRRVAQGVATTIRTAAARQAARA